MWIITASLFTFAWLDQVYCEAASLRNMFPLGFPLQQRHAVMNTQKLLTLVSPFLNPVI